MHEHPVGPGPETPIREEEREVVVGRVRRAMSDELIAFDEIDARFEAIYAATSRAELAVVTQDLPQLPPPSTAPPRHPIARQRFSVFGEIKTGGDIALEGDVSYRSVFGSVAIELSAVGALSDGVTIRASSVFGDVSVILPDGYRVAIEARSIFDNSVDALSPPLPGSATVRVVASSVFGKTKVFSLSRVPEGRLRRLWNSFRGRSNSTP